MSGTKEHTSLDQALERADDTSGTREGEVIEPSQDSSSLARVRVGGKTMSKLSAALLEMVDEDPLAPARVYMDALSATKTVYQGTEWVDLPDYSVRLKAADAIHNRILGLPTARTELTGADGGPLTLAAVLAADAADAY